MLLKIKEIPKEERPMERLIYYGAEKLSNEELLAILIKTGSRDLSAKDLACAVIHKAGGIQFFKELNFQKLKEIKGIGDMKASTLLAAIELAKRLDYHPYIMKEKITSPEMVFHYYHHKMLDKMQEEFHVLYLNTKKEVIKEHCVFVGTLNQSLVHPREVFKGAFLYSANSFICIHNHPSGDVRPSHADIEITKQLIEIGKNVGIHLNDHIIIGKNKYYSFFEENPW